MAYTTRERLALQKQPIPTREEMMPSVREYIAHSGLNLRQFATLIGYSVPTVSQWFNGNYDRLGGTDIKLRWRILELIKNRPAVKRRLIKGTFHETANTRMLREDFYLALDDNAIVVRHGNPGTMKSGCAEALIDELDQIDAGKNGHGRRAYMVTCLPRMKPMELLREIASACGAFSGPRLAMLKNIAVVVGSRRAVLIVDEAQFLDEECIELLRYLNDNAPYFGLLILGSHDLPRKFQGLSMEQCRSRLQVNKSLPSLTREEGQRIVRAELPWMSKDSVAELVEQSYTPDRLVQSKEAHALGLKAGTQPPPYLSARDLFRNIEAIKRARAARDAQKGGAA